MRSVFAAAVLFLLVTATPVVAQAPPPPIPAAATGDHIDPAAATAAYLATMPADKKARSDAYFEGGYWVMLWSFLINAAILLALLQFGVSARIRSAAAITKRRPLQIALYGLAFVLVVFAVSLPWSIYTDFVREHQYRARDPDVRRLVRRRAEGIGGFARAGAARIDGAVRGAPTRGPHVVDLGVARHDRVHDRDGRRRSCLHRADLQHVHAAAAESDARQHPSPGARQRDIGQ